MTNSSVGSIVVKNGMIFAATSGGLFVSRDNGTSWTQTESPLAGSIAILALMDTTLFAGTQNYSGIERSSDNGRSWKDVQTGVITPATYSLAVMGTNLFAGTGVGVFLSTNYGTTWNQANLHLTNTNVYSVAVTGTGVLAGTNGGVFISDNNGTAWTTLNSGLTSYEIRSLALSSGINTDPTFFAGTVTGIFESTNLGVRWTEVDSGIADKAISCLAFNRANLFAGGYGLFLSTNGGTFWTELDTGPTNKLVTCVAANGTNLFAGTQYGGGVFRSTDGGMNWTQVDSGLADTGVQCLAFSGTNIFAGTIYGGGVFLSTNNGDSWKAVNTGLVTSVYAPPSIHALAVSNNVIVAATSYGIYFSTNNGALWTAANEGLGGIEVSSIATGSTSGKNSNTFIYAGTFGSGVWRRPLSEMITSVKVSSPEIPQLFRLEQNFPNPFNPTTSIRYSLPQRSQVTLSMFNTLGQQVATLVNETQEAGYHDVRFDGNGLASGVYFYRIQAGSFVQTKKLLILR
jgi:ligand-binding sensor domain-containing protein